MANLSSLNFRLTANIAPFRKGLNKAERSMDRFGRKMQQTGKNLSMKLTAPMAALGAVSFSVFKDFEAEMSKVQAVSGATAEEFKMLSDNAKQLGASTMFSAREVASLQTEFAKLGFTAPEIAKVTGATLALAQASGTDLARAAEVAGSTLRAFGLDATETNRVTDVMAKSFSVSALDMESFAESMKYVAPVAKAAGMSLEETSAMLAVMSKAGIKGSQAGTSLRRIISEIGASGKPTSEALADLAAKGLDLADAKDEVGRSAQQALLVLASGVNQIKPLTNEFVNADGAAQQMADTMGDNAFGAGKRLESAMEGLAISMGEIVSVAIVPMVEKMEQLAGKLNNASPATKKLIVGVMALAAAIGPMLFLIGGAIRNFTILRSAIVALNLSQKATAISTKALAAAQKILNFVMNLNPVVRVTTAILGLSAAIGGAVVMYRNIKRRQDEARDSLELTNEQLEAQKQRLMELRDENAKLSSSSYDANIRPIERELKLMEVQGATEEQLHNKRIELLNARRLEIIKQQSFLYDDAEQQKKLQQDLLDVEADIQITKLEYQKKLTEARRTELESIIKLADAEQKWQSVSVVSVDVLHRMGQKFAEVEQKALSYTRATTEGMQQAIDVTSGLAYEFSEHLANSISSAIVNGESFFQSFITGLKAMAARLIATIALVAILATLLVIATGGLSGLSLQSVGVAMKAVNKAGNFNVPFMAEGGVVTGPTLAMIGEGRESEAVIPLSKLGSMMNTGGSQNVIVTGRISGQDILLSNERATRNRTRQRGF